MAQVIDGRAIAQSILKEIAHDVSYLSNKYAKVLSKCVKYGEELQALSKGREIKQGIKWKFQVPGLAVVIVGERKDSQTYVRMKRKACAEVGIKSIDVDLPGDAPEEKVLDAVLHLNANPQVHGISVQLPLPPHINEEKILSAISIEKDVDGFHPINIGKLAMKGREPLFVPCTPKGSIELLKQSGVSISRKRAVVVGRSNIEGLPTALLLIRLDATVTIVHSETPDPKSIIRKADIIIASLGQANMIRGDWIKPGAAVIDVGTNAVDDLSRNSGYRLVGDVTFEEAKEVAGWITPVPGGVGPMIVAMLLRNTVDGVKRACDCKSSRFHEEASC